MVIDWGKYIFPKRLFMYESSPCRGPWLLYSSAWERHLPPLARFSCSWTMVLWSSLMMSWWPSCCMSAAGWRSCIFGAVSMVFVTCTLAGWDGVIIHTPRSSICLCFQAFSRMTNVRLTGSISCGVSWSRFSFLFSYCQHLHDLETNDTSTAFFRLWKKVLKFGWAMTI